MNVFIGPTNKHSINKISIILSFYNIASTIQINFHIILKLIPITYFGYH